MEVEVESEATNVDWGMVHSIIYGLGGSGMKLTVRSNGR